MSCTVSTVATRSAGISGYAEFLGQLSAKDKSAAMVDYIKPPDDDDGRDDAGSDVHATSGAHHGHENDQCPDDTGGNDENVDD